jgi:hypothetical protein
MPCGNAIITRLATTIFYKKRVKKGERRFAPTGVQ